MKIIAQRKLLKQRVSPNSHVGAAMKHSQLSYLQQFQNQPKAKLASALTAAKILTKTNKKAGQLAGFFI
jgi:ABC-type phosphate/phosphonate transport system ATPase subunit